MIPTQYLPPALIPFFKESNWTDFLINSTDEFFIDDGSGLKKLSFDHFHWSESDLRQWAMCLIHESGKNFDAKRPFVDGTLGSTYRFHILFPPIHSKSVIISLRKISQKSSKLWEKDPLFHQAISRVKNKKSVLIAGSTSSGKTTLLSELLNQMDPSERIISLEDTPEINSHHPHHISLVSRQKSADGIGEVQLRDLLKECLRMRPNRIIMGECRGSEILDFLITLNTGHQGALATIHANSAREALKRVELLALLSQSHLNSSFIKDLIALGLQSVIYLESDHSTRKIKEIYDVLGREGDTLLLRPVLNTQ